MPPDTCATLVRDGDRDRYLATLYAPASVRPALFALHALDLELARVVATTTEPMIGEIRLAWWREALLKLDLKQVPAQPVLRAIATDVLPYGISGRSLETMEDAFHSLLIGKLRGEALETYVITRGGALFTAIGHVLDVDHHWPRELGAGWALGELAREPLPERVDGDALRAFDFTPVCTGVPVPLRPLAALAKLARRDRRRWLAGQPPEPRGSLGRQAAMLNMIVTGR